ncbi:GNAT family N-acetyltransferase [Streptomyces sp. NPDC051907]|uniref:GNAT family N-acetyltransferase n=1 Tax=Streptomyces sp. NPDC051907 TaxID=3155284 RepID=UPI00341BF8E0
MTTTLRPTGPLQRDERGVQSRSYEVCVNGRPVGRTELSTHPTLGPKAGAIRMLRIDRPDRRRGRGTVAALAAEEVLRGWGCTQVLTSIAPDATAAQRLATALGYTERGRSMTKALPEQPPELPAHVVGRPMTEAEYGPWLAQAVDAYAQEWISRGVPREEALAKSEADHRENLPEGLATPGVFIHVLVHDGETVGHVWVGPREPRFQERGAFVYDVEVVEGRRGQGHGRSLMLLAERVATGAGMRRIGLHVFAGNTPALGLYESLGYETTAFNLFKPLL